MVKTKLANQAYVFIVENKARVGKVQERLFYTQAAKKFGWMQDALTNQIENKTL